MPSLWDEIKEEAVRVKLDRVKVQISCAKYPSIDNDDHRKSLLASHPDWINAAGNEATYTKFLKTKKDEIILKQQKEVERRQKWKSTKK